MTAPNLDQHKIQIIEGINDVPEEPNFQGNGKGCNGAYFIDRFHGALDTLSGHLAGLSLALYPEKTLPFVAADPGLLTYGTYNLVEDDFAKTLSPSSSLTAGYTLAITIPSGLQLPVGLQTYFAVKGGCRVSLTAGAGVNLFVFDDAPYLEPLHVWVLICTGTNNYSLYRMSAAKTQSTYGSLFMVQPEPRVIPLFTSPKTTRITGLLGLKVSQGSVTASVSIDGVSVTGLSALTITSVAQSPTALGANVVSPGSRATFVITNATEAINLEFTLAAEVS